MPNASTHARFPFPIWPTCIIGCFVVFIAGLLTFIVFASTQRNDLVRPDYYEAEIRYQQQIDRIQRTQSMPQPAAIVYDGPRRRITIQLPAAHAHVSSGQVHLYRPSDARLDRELPLALDTEGRQQLDAASLRSGLWKVRVQWSVAGEDYYLDQALVLPSF
ncbi:MAG: FixH family protein [Verrucomicrobiia bacterium]